MKSRSDRAIVIMAIGKKYDAQMNFVLPQFEEYAKHCGADLRIIREAPDSANTHPILTQKLLIPSQFSEYEIIAYFDLDILISKTAPSIFEFVSPDAGFSACASPRDETGFKNMFLYHYNLPEKVEETHASYFTDRGFDLEGIDPDRFCSINGGVWVARPEIVSTLFRETYFNISQMKKENKELSILFEEELMAYTTQKNDIFQPLDQRFNKQIIYDIYTVPDTAIAAIRKNFFYRIFRKLNKIEKIPKYMYVKIMPKIYVSYIEALLAENFAVHFAGGFEYMGIRPKGSYIS